MFGRFELRRLVVGGRMGRLVQFFAGLGILLGVLSYWPYLVFASFLLDGFVRLRLLGR